MPEPVTLHPPGPTPAPTQAGPWRLVRHASPSSVEARLWNGWLAASAQPSPFLRHEWLQALHEQGCATPETGWTPCLLTAHAADDDDLTRPVGGCVSYLKTHSYGEYVFDWAWADAYHRHGLRYYPKVVCASPFTPVPGSRLLAADAGVRAALLHELTSLAHDAGASSVHLLFPAPDDLDAARAQGWLLRQGVQFHWRNRHDATPGAAPYADMDDFLASLQRDKRKKIQQERRRVREAGVTLHCLEGDEIGSDDWDAFFRGYVNTYRAHGSPPYLNRGFFEQVGTTLRPHWLMVQARRDGRILASSLIGIDREHGVAWGRYWGCDEHIPCLHFELCYYSPLQWCIEQGFRRFEGGAQGEHKMARGLLPVSTGSAHWLSDPRFSEAVADFLSREGRHVGGYLDELRERQPFKADREP